MTIFINEVALKRIQNEVKKSKGIETGGIILGVILKTGDILITHAIDPGPNAIKKHNEFAKDYDYSLAMLNLLYRKYSVDYLGEWHKHPNNCVYYSYKDYLTMIKITNINTRPCFFIIVGEDFQYKDFSHINVYSVNKNDNSIVKNSFEIICEPEKLALERKIVFDL